MNKTISVNIGGRVFNIEELAFDKLSKYINTIRGYFEGHESTDEIISDIELRIAELFMDLVSDQKQVITTSDVDEVIKIMGRPEDYVDEDEAEERAHRSSKSKTNKRVFRDPDNKVIFGVCGGISAYLGWDPIVLRAIFVIGTLVFGTGVLFYIILAIIIPKAITTADKLRMRGEPVTVDNISKKVNESVDGMKEDIRDFSEKNNINKDSITGFGRSVGGFFEDLANILAKILRALLAVITKVLGVVFLLAGISGILFTIAVLFGHESFIAMTENHIYHEDQIQALIDGTFSSTFQYVSFLIGMTLVIIVPAIAFLILGIKLLFDYKRIPGFVGIVLIILWLCGFGFLSACGFKMFRDFNVETSFTERVPLEMPLTDTLYLDLTNTNGTLYKFDSGFNSRRFFYADGVTFPSSNSTDIIYGDATDFTVEFNKSDTVYELFIERSAHGANNKEAVTNARQGKSAVEVSGDSLLISPQLLLPEGSKIRGQEVNYILRIPVGKAIHFTENSREIIYDVPNVTDTHDSKMIGLTWIMTEDGLKCTTPIEGRKRHNRREWNEAKEALEEAKRLEREAAREMIRGAEEMEKVLQEELREAEREIRENVENLERQFERRAHEAEDRHDSELN